MTTCELRNIVITPTEQKYAEEEVWKDEAIATQAWCEETFAMKGVLSLTESNTTITHYCPYEPGTKAIHIGDPVFMSGHVYKRIGSEWIPSTEHDSTDCICSVVGEGTYKQFVGVVVSFDPNETSLTFASHGDFLFHVDDSSAYELGDTVLFDGRILDENYVPSHKIHRSIVGVVCARVGKNMVAIFRS